MMTMPNDDDARAEPHPRIDAEGAIALRPLRNGVRLAVPLAMRRSAKILVVAGTAALASGHPAIARPLYDQIATIALGAPNRWDYVVADPSAHHVYVAHGDGLTVVDTSETGVIGTVRGVAAGTHGTAISAATGQGFTDDGAAGRVIAFDLETLAITRSIPSAPDADAIAIEPVTGHVFVVEGDPGTLTVIDPTSDTAIATIGAGEKLEYAVADGAGAILVAGERGVTWSRSTRAAIEWWRTGPRPVV